TDDEFQFDFIKDRTVNNLNQYRQVRGQKYAVLDELDQILLDKATSDHIISNPYAHQEIIKVGNGTYTEQELSALFAIVVDQLEEGKDYTVDESKGEINIYDAEAEAIKQAKKIDDQIPWWLVKLIGKEPPADISHNTPQGWTKIEALLRRSDLIENQTEPILGENERFQGNIPEQLDNAGADLQIYLLNAIRAKSMEREEESHRLNIDSDTSMGEIELEDPFTRRLLQYSRYTEGLHQALEARQQLIAFKNGTGVMVPIRADQGVLTATATSSYFRRYKEITGSSGSLIVRENRDNPEQLDYTPAAELYLTYGKNIMEIPPNNDPQLTVNPEIRVYSTVEEKLGEIVFEIVKQYGYTEDNPDEDPQLHKRVRPILVGLYDKAQMEQLRNMLNESFVPFFNQQHPDSPIHIQLLSAEDTQEEGRIIANAGIPNTITIASIAGRGTDIMLGGERPQDLALIGERPLDDRRPQTQDEWQRLHEETKALGGLYAIGEPGLNQRISIQFAGRPREIGAWLEIASWQDYFIRKAYGPKGAEALANVVGDLPLTAKESRNIIDKAQTRNANRDAKLRTETLRDYETIDMQFDAFYQDRDRIVRTEHMEPVVRDLTRSYIRSILMGDASKVTSTLLSPLDQDSSVPADTYMTGEEVLDFTRNVCASICITQASIETNPSDKIFAQEIFQLARKSTKRELIDLTTEKIAERFHAFYEQQGEMQKKASQEARTYVLSLNIPENQRQKAAAHIDLIFGNDYPSLDTFAHEATLITADARMGNHYSQLLSLRTSIMRIRALQDRFPADTFRQEAGLLYRGFKQRMQESVLKTLFLSQNYVNYTAAHVAKQALEVAKHFE
ncbi:MAG: hypothetical protein KGL95_05595, partial [Patescibacteria group bacterium]|nr:hypothetical protein [Patescibacteria group bacterium]